MSKDLIARARAVAAGNHQSEKAIDAGAGSSSFIARVRAGLESPPEQTLVASTPPAPRIEHIKAPMTCSAKGASYVAIFERRDDELRLIGHKFPKHGAGGGRQPGHLSGSYRIDLNGMRCPLCGNGDAVWLCECSRMQGAMHCHGSSGGIYRCACGRNEEREFVNVPRMEVRGSVRGMSQAAPAEQNRSASRQGQPQLKQVTHER